METPSSTRRVTRSQTMAAATCNTTANYIPMSKKIDECEMSVNKSMQRSAKKQQDRSALIDISNDSPIVGLAKASFVKTPSSEMSKKRVNSKAIFGTPGSGEALLRGQVQNLLQKVEGEAELSRISVENSRPFLHQLQLKGLLNSPMHLLAPTPANTPEIPYVSDHQIIELASLTQSPVEEKNSISQTVTEILEGKKQEAEAEKDLVTRSLLFDFSEKLEGFDSSSEERKLKLSSSEDDEASVWSIQVNVSSSTRDDDEEEEEKREEVVEKCNDELGYEEGEEYDDGLVNELCEGIRKMNMNGMAKPAGKHTRFVYDSDGELVDFQEEPAAAFESDIKTPQGRHIRFHLDDSDEESS